MDSSAGSETRSAVPAWAQRWRWLLGAYLLVLAFLSLNPWLRPESTGELIAADKLDHALAYGGLAVLIYLCFAPPRCMRTRVWALAGAMLAGVAIEVGQSLFTSSRSGSVEDVVANAIGALAGLVVFRFGEFLYSRWRPA